MQKRLTGAGEADNVLLFGLAAGAMATLVVLQRAAVRLLVRHAARGAVH